MNSKVKDFYSQYFPEEGSTHTGDEWTVRCLFHQDNKPSLSINLETGVWKCHAASCPQHAGGNMIRFLSLIENITMDQAAEQLGFSRDPKKEYKTPVTEEEVVANQEALLKNTSAMNFLMEKCGYTLETIKFRQLGWDGDRIWIPIRGKNGEIVNIRKYHPKPKDGIKVKGCAGFNTARLFPIENLSNDPIYIMEGEKDCILANQLGLNAVTVTGGAGTFRQEWGVHFTDKTVYICYDIDESGKEGARKVADMIAGRCKCRIIELPITEPANGDFTDYIVFHKKSIQDFLAIKDTAELRSVGDATFVTIPDELHDTTLDKAAYGDYMYKRVKMNIRVIGKESSPFIIPKTVEVSCNRTAGRKCNICHLDRCNLKDTITFDELRPEILSFVECNDDVKKNVMRKTFGITSGCYEYTLIERAHQYIDSMEAVAVMEMSIYLEKQEHVTRSLYALAHKMSSNQDYKIEAITLPHPKTQHLVYLVYKSEPSETSLTSFVVTDEIINALKVFQCQSSQ